MRPKGPRVCSSRWVQWCFHTWSIHLDSFLSAPWGICTPTYSRSTYYYSRSWRNPYNLGHIFTVLYLLPRIPTPTQYYSTFLAWVVVETAGADGICTQDRHRQQKTTLVGGYSIIMLFSCWKVLYPPPSIVFCCQCLSQQDLLFPITMSMIKGVQHVSLAIRVISCLFERQSCWHQSSVPFGCEFGHCRWLSKLPCAGPRWRLYKISHPNDAVISFVIMPSCTICAIECKKRPCLKGERSNQLTATQKSLNSRFVVSRLTRHHFIYRISYLSAISSGVIASFVL